MMKEKEANKNSEDETEDCSTTYYSTIVVRNDQGATISSTSQQYENSNEPSKNVNNCNSNLGYDEKVNENSHNLIAISSTNIIENDEQIFQTASPAPPPISQIDEVDQIPVQNQKEEMTTTAAKATTNNSIGTGMDNNVSYGHQHDHHLYEQRRLPPDGHEFPNSWLDEGSNSHDTSNGINGTHEKFPNKLYRSEYNLVSSKSPANNHESNSVRPASPPPPPPPRSEPPQLDEETMMLHNQFPPPIPSQPVPTTALTRRSSIEERRRLYELANVHNPGLMESNHIPPLAPAKPSEPSRKSVKDKIAMFSSSSDRNDDTGATVKFNDTSCTSSPSLSNNRHEYSSSFASQLSNGHSAKFRSTEHLPSRLEVFDEASYESPTLEGTNSWKMNKSTTDLRQPTKLYSAPFKLNEEKSNQNQPHSSNLCERSQSLLNVGQPQNTIVNAVIEERRRGTMSKLRGLVIPDKTNMGQNSVSVMDLPTIYSKDAPSTNTKPIPNSKPPIKQQPISLTRKQLIRTESLDGMSSCSSSSESSSRNQKILRSNMAPASAISTTTDLSDWKFSTALPKYSPAFKRRSLTAYQTAITSPTMKSNLTANFKTTTTPEPKSLESCTSPRSDSSFEYLSPTSDQPKIVGITTVTSVQRNYGNMPAVANSNKSSIPSLKTQAEKKLENSKTNKSSPKRGSNGRLIEDSDTDSAVSSSRSSISHELSPPNSPVPRNDHQQKLTQPPVQNNEHITSQEPRYTNISHENVAETTSTTEDSANNSDEGWRILKPQSVEAINRKNVLASAKYSNGTLTSGDALSANSASAEVDQTETRGKYSSHHQSRRSDDDEASYADGETEDTESSCSELEIGKSRRSSGPHHHVLHHNTSSSLNRPITDTEDDEDEYEENLPVSQPLPHQPNTHHHLHQTNSRKNSAETPENDEPKSQKESPLQAIYDMEVKMAYINEICDSLPCTRAHHQQHENRFFSRRESEATVIEHPIERKSSTSSSTITLTSEQDIKISNNKKSISSNSSVDEVDYKTENVLEFAHNSRSNTLFREEGTAPLNSSSNQPSTSRRNSAEDAKSASMIKNSPSLEKKYTRTSLSSDNLLNNVAMTTSTLKKHESLSETISKSAASPPHSNILEKKIEKIIESTITTSANNKPVGKSATNIPRGRNDFKSLSEKWQQISSNANTNPKVANSAPEQVPVTTKSSTLSPQQSSCNTYLAKIEQEENTPSLRLRAARSGIGENREREREEKKPWIVPRRIETTSPAALSTTTASNTTSSTKRSVSVNDIRKAFEKAEIAVNTYGRDDNSSSDNLMLLNNKVINGKEIDSSSILSPPSAHFRVSSFDSTTSEDSSANTPAGIYGSVSNLVSSSSSAQKDPYGSITSLASSTSLISPQELQQLIDEANQSLEEAGTPSHEVSVVILHREFAGGSLGITLAGGADYETKEITVHKVLSGSIADRDGRIHRGDRVLSINGKSTKGSTHREALNLLKAPRTEVVLVVSRGRSTSNGFSTIEETAATLDRAVEPLLNGSLASLLENDEDTKYNWGPMRTVILNKDGAGLGFSLEGGQGSISGDKPLTIKKIFVGGPAEKSGALKVGDLITSINDVNMSTKSRTEAWNFMKKLSDGEVKLLVKSPL